MERAKIHKYLDYEVAIMHVPPFWQAAIFAAQATLPEVDWAVEPIRAGNSGAAFDLAKVRINKTVADLAATKTAD
jgi:hypothetical protein